MLPDSGAAGVIVASDSGVGGRAGDVARAGRRFPYPQLWGEGNGVDALHHTVYAGVNGVAYDYLKRH
ncbi:MAG: hypothetical protein ACRDTJ_13800 [Pseudonocardiaceae bacterium]